jgi:hypothetical protein
MAGAYPFRQRFCEVLDWIALVKRTEWGRLAQRRLPRLANRVTFCAIGLGERKPALLTRFESRCR